MLKTDFNHFFSSTHGGRILIQIVRVPFDEFLFVIKKDGSVIYGKKNAYGNYAFYPENVSPNIDDVWKSFVVEVKPIEYMSPSECLRYICSIDSLYCRMINDLPRDVMEMISTTTIDWRRRGGRTENLSGLYQYNVYEVKIVRKSMRNDGFIVEHGFDNKTDFSFNVVRFVGSSFDKLNDALSTLMRIKERRTTDLVDIITIYPQISTRSVISLKLDFPIMIPPELEEIMNDFYEMRDGKKKEDLTSVYNVDSGDPVSETIVLDEVDPLSDEKSKSVINVSPEFKDGFSRVTILVFDLPTEFSGARSSVVLDADGMKEVRRFTKKTSRYRTLRSVFYNVLHEIGYRTKMGWVLFDNDEKAMARLKKVMDELNELSETKRSIELIEVAVPTKWLVMEISHYLDHLKKKNDELSRKLLVTEKPISPSYRKKINMEIRKIRSTTERLQKLLSSYGS